MAMHKKPTTLMKLIFIFLLAINSGCSKGNIDYTAGFVNQNTETETIISTPGIEFTPTASTDINITDGLGRKVHLSQPAKRVVSLAPSNTEILFAIGASSQVIGRDSFSDYPESTNQIDDVGGGYGEFDLEKVVSLKPDLVLASSLNPQELVTKLEGLNLTVFYLANPTDLDGMYENLLIVGQLTDHSAEAELLIEKLRERVEKIVLKTKDIKERPVVFYELDATDPAAPWTSGKGTFIDSLLNLAGGKNLGSVLDSAWAKISLEEIIAQDPDIILIGNMVRTGISVDAVKARPGWDALSAIKNNHIYEFDDNLVSRPGPRLVDGLEALTLILHPELFQ
jgi:iron complex transport system substrate-binding protein